MQAEGKLDKPVFGVHYDTPENKFDFESENPDNPFNEEDDDDDDDDDGELIFVTFIEISVCVSRLCSNTILSNDFFLPTQKMMTMRRKRKKMTSKKFRHLHQHHSHNWEMLMLLRVI